LQLLDARSVDPIHGHLGKLTEPLLEQQQKDPGHSFTAFFAAFFAAGGTAFFAAGGTALFTAGGTALLETFFAGCSSLHALDKARALLVHPLDGQE